MGFDTGTDPAPPPPLGSLSPAEFQRQWASNIIAGAARKKSLGRLERVMSDLADRIEEIEDVVDAEQRPPSPRAAALLDVFDGRLGVARVTLKSRDALFAATAAFTAAPGTADPDRLRVSAPGADGVRAEIVVDALRASSLAFEARDDGTLAVIASSDDGPFLAVAVSSPGDGETARWRDLEAKYS